MSCVDVKLHLLQALESDVSLNCLSNKEKLLKPAVVGNALNIDCPMRPTRPLSIPRFSVDRFPRKSRVLR